MASAVLVTEGSGSVDSGKIKIESASAVLVAGDAAAASCETVSGGAGGMASAGTFNKVSFGGGGGIMDIAVVL